MTSSQSGYYPYDSPVWTALPTPATSTSRLDSFIGADRNVFSFLRPLQTSGPMSAATARQAVIDLTGDDAEVSSTSDTHPSARTPAGITASSSTRATRPPNFERDIIDVDALPDEPESRAAQLRPPSPDVEVTFSRSLPSGARRRRSVPPARPTDPDGLGGAMAFFNNPLGPAFPSHANIALTPANPSGPAGHARRRQEHYRLGVHLLDRIAEQGARRIANPADIRRRQETVASELTNQNRLWQGMTFGPAFVTTHRYGPMHGPEVIIADEPPLPGFDPPNINYELVGFQNQPSVNHGSSVKPPTPPPAREGFTRSLNEQQVLVCPNCDDELGSGETDEKRSVWFVRGCGHVGCLIHYDSVFFCILDFINRHSDDLKTNIIQVYCGDCVSHRSVARKRGQRIGHGEPFKACKVCDRAVSSKTAFKQIFI